MLAFGRLTITERGMARVTLSILEFYISLNLSGMAEDGIVKFCTRVGPRRLVLSLQTVTDLRKILHGGQRMASVHSGEEIWPTGPTP